MESALSGVRRWRTQSQITNDPHRSHRNCWLHCVTRRPYQRFRTLEAHGIVRAIPYKEVAMPTLEQIQANIKKLQVQADALIAKKAQAAVDQIRQIMLKHGLTTEDIEAKAKAKREAKAANGSAPKVKAKTTSSL